MIIAVDFDGTIVQHRYPDIGKEIPFAIVTIRSLIEDGHHVILWTVREGPKLEEAVEFCRQRGVEFYAVNSEYPGASWSGSGVSRKIKADVYIDDANIGGIPDWAEIYQMISRRPLNGHPYRYHHNGRSKSRNGFFRKLADRCAEARKAFTKH